MTTVTSPYTGFTAAEGPATVTTTYPSTVSPSVITSSTANKDYQNIQAQHSDIVSGMQNQATTIANNQAVSDTQTQAKTQAETDAKLASDKLAIDKQNADAKMAAVTGTNPTGDLGIDKAQDGLDQAQTDYQNTAKQVQDTISGISNGSVPLNEGQLAQVEGLKQQFQQLIDQQKLTNIGASGTANLRGYQKGAAEYDPTFATNTIGSIVQAGANKVADLNVKMASAVANLTEAFKDKDIQRVKDAWSVYQDASKKRTDSLQKTIDDTQKVIKEAQTAKAAAEKLTYDRVIKPIQDITKDAVKNGAPIAVQQAIAKASSPEEAMAAAGQYLQTGTGVVGEYQFYKREEEAAGRVPMSFNSYSTLDANRKIALTKAANTNDKKSNAFSTINQLLGVKNAEGMPYLDTNGYLTAKGFKDLVLAASEDGVSRADFLAQYGSYIAPTEAQAYGLTPKEKTALGFK